MKTKRPLASPRQACSVLIYRLLLLFLLLLLLMLMLLLALYFLATFVLVLFSVDFVVAAAVCARAALA
jgi:hypothetical protein